MSTAQQRPKDRARRLPATSGRPAPSDASVVGHGHGDTHTTQPKRRRGRPTVQIVLTEDERQTLERWAQRRTSSQALALRCRIVLACAQGLSNVEWQPTWAWAETRQVLTSVQRTASRHDHDPSNSLLACCAPARSWPTSPSRGADQR
jgi:hypothetical protein